MTDNNHPITPPDELIDQWLKEYYGTRRTGQVNAVERHLATQAARWGADQEPFYAHRPSPPLSSNSFTRWIWNPARSLLLM